MNKPIRIAQVMGKMNGGGVEAVVMNYYRHIDKERIQFDFLVDADSSQIPSDEIESLGGRIFEVPPYSHPIAYQKSLRSLFGEEGWSVVHSHINALSVFSLRAAKKSGVPIRIAHSHNTSGKGEHVRNVIKNILRLFANVYPTHRFACSEHAGRWLFGRKPYTVVHNAVELSKFVFDADVRRGLREELSISADTVVIGHAGRFMPQKNHSFLLEAFAGLCRSRDDCVLLCVGDGPLLEDMKQKAVALGIADKVLFTGYRNDLYRFYQAFDVFVLPSLYEGLGMVAIEAQCAGLPCLLSDAVPSEADVTGTVQFLSVEDPSTWTDALSHFEAGARLLVNEECFSCYDIDLAAQRVMTLYEEMAREVSDEE